MKGGKSLTFLLATVPCGNCTGLLFESTRTKDVCPFTVIWFRNNICGIPRELAAVVGVDCVDVCA